MSDSNPVEPVDSLPDERCQVDPRDESGVPPASPRPLDEDALNKDTSNDAEAVEIQHPNEKVSSTAGDSTPAATVSSSSEAPNLPSQATGIPPSAGTDSGSTKQKKRGSPSHFTDEQLAFLEEFLQAYIALQKGSKEKELFLRDVIASYLELFPIEVYGAPPVNPKLTPLPSKTQDQIDAMNAKQRKSYNKIKAVREATDEERLANAIKNWFFWRQGCLKRKADELNIGKFINDLRERAAPRKRQMTHFVMTHPDYKDEVKRNSKEEGMKDRLACRRVAAHDIIVRLEAEGKLADLVKERNAEHEAAMSVWNTSGQDDQSSERDKFRASVGHITQPFLNRLSDVTGLHFVLLAGEDTDGRGNFNAMAVTSHPDKYTPIDKFRVGDFQSMAQVFYKWLQMIRLKDGPATGSTLPFDPQDLHTISSAPITNSPVISSTTAPSSASLPPTNSHSITSSIPKSPQLSTDKGQKDQGESSESRGALGQNPGEKDRTNPSDTATDVPLDGGDDGARTKEPELTQGGSSVGTSYEELRRATIAANKAALRKLQVDSGLFTADGTLTFLPSAKAQKSQKTAEKAKSAKAKQKAGSSAPQQPVRRSRRHQRNTDSEEVEQEVSTAGPSAREAHEPSQNGNPSADAVEKETVSVDRQVDAPARDEHGFLREEKDMEWINSPTDEEQSLNWDNQGSTRPERHREGSEEQAGPSDSSKSQPGASDGHVDDHAATSSSSTTPTPTRPDTPKSTSPSPPNPLQDLRDLYGAVDVPRLRADEQYDPNGMDCPSDCTRKLSLIDFLKFLLHVPENCNARPAIWPSLVYKWADLEERWRDFGIEEKAVSTKHRTGGFEWWQKNGRFRTTALSTPAEARETEYGLSWWKWWTDINPPWRRRGDMIVLPDFDGDISDLHRPGKAGLVLLLVGLRWWYDGNPEADVDGVWTAAAKSVFVTVDALMRDAKRHQISLQDEPEKTGRSKRKNQASEGQPGNKKQRTSDSR